MIVVCDVTACSFNENKFCTQPIVSIENATCGRIFKRGAQRMDFAVPVDEECKEKMIIEDAESWVEVSSEQEQPRKEEKNE